MDRLIIDRWQDVSGLMEAWRETEDRIEEMIDIVGERLGRWTRPQGFEIEIEPKYAEFKFARTSWIDRRRGAKVQLAVGGLCPSGYKKMEADHPYLFVYIGTLSNFKMKEADLKAFSHSLREALGAEARGWEAHDVDDTEQPLGRYLTGISDADRAKLIASEDALFNCVTEHAPALFALADIIEGELTRIQR